MGRPRRPVRHQGQWKRNREQYERDRERIKFGTQGAASDVRKVDVASVNTAALVEQLERQRQSPSTGRMRWPMARSKILTRVTK
jgi:hypothetical protein